MPNADLTTILQVISLIGAAFLIARLLITGLWREYPVFFWYFVFRIPNTLWPLFINFQSNSRVYQKVWICTEPVAWLFHVLVVFELCRLVLTGHRGLFTLGKWAMYISLLIAIAISVLSLIPKFKPRMTFDTKMMGTWFAVARGIDFALAVFLILLLFFLSRFPVKLKRNVVVHATLYTLFFFGEAFTVFLRTFFGATANHSTSLFLTAFSCACILAWIILLTPQGELVQASFPTFSPQREQTALRQLENLNATLLKVSSK
jgi:hypothetical protein